MESRIWSFCVSISPWCFARVSFRLLDFSVTSLVHFSGLCLWNSLFMDVCLSDVCMWWAYAFKNSSSQVGTCYLAQYFRWRHPWWKTINFYYILFSFSLFLFHSQFHSNVLMLFSCFDVLCYLLIKTLRQLLNDDKSLECAIIGRFCVSVCWCAVKLLSSTFVFDKEFIFCSFVLGATIQIISPGKNAVLFFLFVPFILHWIYSVRIGLRLTGNETEKKNEIKFFSLLIVWQVARKRLVFVFEWWKWKIFSL